MTTTNDENYKIIYEAFRSKAEECGVLFYYAGDFTAEVVSTAAETFRASIAEKGAPVKVQRKLFSTFIEMGHNILHYSVAEIDDQGNKKKHGNIAVGTNGKRFWLVCANKIDPAHADRLSEKLEAVRSMSLEEIKRAYKEQLNNTGHEVDDSISKGAGLGLLTMARDSSAPLEYGFNPSPEDQNKPILFHVMATFDSGN